MPALAMWTVYDHPRDYPDVYAARRFEVSGDGARPTGTMMACPDLDSLRGQLRDMGLVCLTRNPDDDPCILETWL